MDELPRILAVSNWLLTFVAMLTFLGVVVSAWALYLARGTKQSVERVARSVERVEESAERLGYYLFGKLGPLELPKPPQ